MWLEQYKIGQEISGRLLMNRVVVFLAIKMSAERKVKAVYFGRDTSKMNEEHFYLDKVEQNEYKKNWLITLINDKSNVKISNTL